MGIYIVQVDHDGPVKIGFTDMDPKIRLASLQAYNHAELRLLAVLPGGRKKEKQLHQRFANSHLRGEWYDLTDALKAFIESLPVYTPVRPSRPRTRRWRYFSADERKRIKAIWRDNGISTDVAASAKAGLSVGSLRTHLGPSGRDKIKNIISSARLGGAARKRAIDKNRMPKAAAFEIWRRKDLNTDEALALINADKNYGRTWSMSAAYQHLGPRGAFAGRRPRKK